MRRGKDLLQLKRDLQQLLKEGKIHKDKDGRYWPGPAPQDKPTPTNIQDHMGGPQETSCNHPES